MVCNQSTVPSVDAPSTTIHSQLEKVCEDKEDHASFKVGRVLYVAVIIVNVLVC